jgi:AcrR family transcriptional regulator
VPQSITASAAASESVEASTTKDRILDAAEEEFADKGIAGARVEQIAQRAGVAKALIYYYFEGKKQLLQGIIDRAMAENIAIKRSALEDKAADPDKIEEALLENGMTFVRSRLNMLRIFMSELVKKEDTDISMLEVIDAMFAGLKDLSSSPLFHIDNLNDIEARLPLFLFGSLPISLFFMLEDKWIAHYHIDKETLERQFSQVAKKMFKLLLNNELSE